MATGSFLPYEREVVGLKETDLDCFQTGILAFRAEENRADSQSLAGLRKPDEASRCVRKDVLLA
jgi:hypothetical protein